MRNVFIKESYCGQMGELWDRSLNDLIKEGLDNVDLSNIDAVYIGNMLASVLNKQNHLGAVVAAMIGRNLPVFVCESACASGGVAVYQAWQSVRANLYNNVLVLGVEKMTDFSSNDVASVLAQAATFEEQVSGATMADLYGLVANSFLVKYPDVDLDEISVAAHKKAQADFWAQYKNVITKEDVQNSKLVAAPLRLLHCAPISDGVAALVLSADMHDVELVDMEFAVSSEFSVSKRCDLTSFAVVKYAAEKLLSRVGGDFNQVEVHDCFAVAEEIALRDLGLSRDNVKVNVRGGLKAGGHAVGATGVKQLVTLAQTLLSGEMGLAHNVGGVGSSVVLSCVTKK